MAKTTDRIGKPIGQERHAGRAFLVIVKQSKFTFEWTPDVYFSFCLDLLRKKKIVLIVQNDSISGKTLIQS